MSSFQIQGQRLGQSQAALLRLADTEIEKMSASRAYNEKILKSQIAMKETEIESLNRKISDLELLLEEKGELLTKANEEISMF